MAELFVGMFVGKTIFDIVFSRSVAFALVWLLIPWTAASAAIELLHVRAAGYAAGIAALLAMVLFATTPPPGRLRAALLEGMLLWCGLTVSVALVRLTVHIIEMGLVAGFVHELRWLGFGIAAIALAGLAEWRFERTESGATERDD